MTASVFEIARLDIHGYAEDPSVRGTVESSSKIFDGADVITYGMFRVITSLEFFQHQFTKMGHGDSCDPTYLSSKATTALFVPREASAAGAYVLTGFDEVSR